MNYLSTNISYFCIRPHYKHVHAHKIPSICKCHSLFNRQAPCAQIKCALLMSHVLHANMTQAKT